jgi:hypothetical protein
LSEIHTRAEIGDKVAWGVLEQKRERKRKPYVSALETHFEPRVYVL